VAFFRLQLERGAIGKPSDLDNGLALLGNSIRSAPQRLLHCEPCIVPPLLFWPGRPRHLAGMKPFSDPGEAPLKHSNALILSTIKQRGAIMSTILNALYSQFLQAARHWPGARL
jgi:hypothetical protein